MSDLYDVSTPAAGGDCLDADAHPHDSGSTPCAPSAWRRRGPIVSDAAGWSCRAGRWRCAGRGICRPTRSRPAGVARANAGRVPRRAGDLRPAAADHDLRRRGRIGAALATAQPDRRAFRPRPSSRDGAKPDPRLGPAADREPPAFTLDPPGGVLFRPTRTRRPTARRSASPSPDGAGAAHRRTAQPYADPHRRSRPRPARHAEPQAGRSRIFWRADPRRWLARSGPAVLARLEAWDGDYGADFRPLRPPRGAALHLLLPPLHAQRTPTISDPIEAEWR